MPNMSRKPRTRAMSLIILLLAFILPVQGIAAALAPAHRAMNPDTMAATPCHAQVGEHEGQPASHPTTGAMQHAPDSSHPHNGDHTSDLAPHACCHQVMNAAPGGLLPAVARKFADVSRFVLPLATLYFPDSPDRPPRG